MLFIIVLRYRFKTRGGTGMATVTTILQHVGGSTEILNDINAIIPINMWMISADGLVKRGDGIHTFSELSPLADLYELVDLWNYMNNQRDMLSTIQSGQVYIQCNSSGVINISNGNKSLAILHNPENIEISTESQLNISAGKINLTSTDTTINGERIYTEEDNLSSTELQNTGTRISVTPENINIFVGGVLVGCITNGVYDKNGGEVFPQTAENSKKITLYGEGGIILNAGNTGDIKLESGEGGHVYIISGQSGNVYISPAPSDMHGGRVSIQGGSSINDNGGNVDIKGGVSSTGTHGIVNIGSGLDTIELKSPVHINGNILHNNGQDVTLNGSPIIMRSFLGSFADLEAAFNAVTG